MPNKALLKILLDSSCTRKLGFHHIKQEESVYHLFCKKNLRFLILNFDILLGKIIPGKDHRRKRENDTKTTK